MRAIAAPDPNISNLSEESDDDEDPTFNLTDDDDDETFRSKTNWILENKTDEYEKSIVASVPIPVGPSKLKKSKLSSYTKKRTRCVRHQKLKIKIGQILRGILPI